MWRCSGRDPHTSLYLLSIPRWGGQFQGSGRVPSLTTPRCVCPAWDAGFLYPTASSTSPGHPMGISNLTSKTKLLTAPVPSSLHTCSAHSWPFSANGSSIHPAAHADAWSHPWLLTTSHPHPTHQQVQWLYLQHSRSDHILPPPHLPAPPAQPSKALLNPNPAAITLEHQSEHVPPLLRPTSASHLVAPRVTWRAPTIATPCSAVPSSGPLSETRPTSLSRRGTGYVPVRRCQHRGVVTSVWDTRVCG